MPSATIPPRRTTRVWPWLIAILLLLTLRLPSLVEPPGNDQSLYMYVAAEMERGGVPYVSAWDQKPPAIYFVYRGLRLAWPRDSIVAAADLGAAGLVAALLVVIGRRIQGPTAGGMAAALFLLFGDPSIQRLSGVYVRGQCETFIELAIAAALVLALRPNRTRAASALAGGLAAIAVWLKYN